MKNLSTLKLLRLYGEVLDELLRRGVVRTRNAPVSDYAEWLVSEKLKLKLERSSKSGYDAVSRNGTRYQIKCRRLAKENNSRQLGVIRNLERNPFDFLVAVLFNQDFSVNGVHLMPPQIIKSYAKYSKHQNGHILILKGDILKDKRVKDLTRKFKK